MSRASSSARRTTRRPLTTIRPPTAPIYANLRTKSAADGELGVSTPSTAISSAQTVTFAANACYGVEIVYSNGNEEAALDAGFKAGDVVLNVKARQPDDVGTTVPVKTIGNTASIEMTYDFGIMGAQDTTATRTKDASASASTHVAGRAGPAAGLHREDLAGAERSGRGHPGPDRHPRPAPLLHRHPHRRKRRDDGRPHPRGRPARRPHPGGRRHRG